MSGTLSPKFISKLHKHGFTTRRTRRGHLLVSRHGQFITCFAGTPSDYRSWRNSMAPLKRAGFPT